MRSFVPRSQPPPALRGNDPQRDGAVQPERRAEGQHEVADLQGVAVAEVDRGQVAVADFQDGDVGRLVAPDAQRADDVAVGEPQVDPAGVGGTVGPAVDEAGLGRFRRGGAGDDVPVGEHEQPPVPHVRPTGVTDQHAAAGLLHAAAVLVAVPAFNVHHAGGGQPGDPRHRLPAEQQRAVGGPVQLFPQQVRGVHAHALRDRGAAAGVRAEQVRGDHPRREQPRPGDRAGEPIRPAAAGGRGGGGNGRGVGRGGGRHRRRLRGGGKGTGSF